MSPNALLIRVKSERRLMMLDLSSSSLVKSYSEMLFKICLVLTRNPYDAEDAVQETFLRYLKKPPDFGDEEHRKAWLIRVATNTCKDLLRFKTRHNHANLDDIAEYCAKPEQTEVLEAVMALPYKLRVTFLLHYVAGYDVRETAKNLSCSENAIKKRLQRGRELLKIELEGENYHDRGTTSEHSEQYPNKA
jgi:RNA polymerase sigma-70 factor (ECF subfamily)